MIGWVFFSLENFSDAIHYIKVLFSFNFHLSEIPIGKEFVVTLLIAGIFSFIGLTKFGIKVQKLIYKEFDYSARTAFAVLFVAVFLYGISASYITSTGFNPFIYFRF
jgi:alginate O-acetyltransferase complex protein AlgI